MHAVLPCTSRWVSRFVLFYWVCFVFPFPFDLIGLPLQVVPEKHQPQWYTTAAKGFEEGLNWVSDRKHEACKWVGRELVGVEVIVQMTGSGDTMRGYVGCLCAAAAAFALACGWSVLLLFFSQAARGVADQRLHAAVRIVVRFFLFEMLLGYGFAKVFPNQFPEPVYRLTQTFGDFSPMGLLWAFMGFSTPYQIFTGAVEVAAGLLLTTRRTTPLGAILTIVAMTQVVALNFCFDVPVKLYSLHYLVMGIFLLLPDLPRILRVMVLHQAVAAAPLRPLFGSVSWDRFAVCLRLVIVAGIVWTNLYQSHESWSSRNGPAPVLGRWEPESFAIDGQDVGANDPRRWKTLDFTIRGMVRVFNVRPPHAGYKVTWDEAARQLTLGKFTNKDWTAVLAYEQPTPEILVLRGSLDGKLIQARLKKLPEKEFELVKRGFHWIQEFPYNR